MGRSLAVIVPVYRNAATVADLHRRVRATVAATDYRCRVVFVDDACPDGSLARLQAIAAADADCCVLALAENGGQNRAVLAGLASLDADAYVVMDADLQDPPERIADLLALLTDAEIAFASRRGVYSSRSRRWSARLYRWCLQRVIGVPRDAGIFSAFRRSVRDRLLAARVERPNVVVMLGATGASSRGTPYVRPVRPEGESAYTHRMRLGVALDALLLALRFRFGIVEAAPFSPPVLRAKLGFRP